MNALQNTPPDAATLIAEAIARHGRLRVLAAAIRAVLPWPPMRPPPLSIDMLDARLRKDVGLAPRLERPRPELMARFPTAL